MNRRILLSTSAVAVPALGLAACSTSTVTQASVKQAISNADRVMGFLAPLVPMLAAFIPSVAKYTADIQTDLAQANTAFNTISAAMDAATAQPIIKRVSTYIGAAIDVANQAATFISDPKQQATVVGMLAEARQVLAYLTAFATDVKSVVMPAAGEVVTRPVLLLRAAR